MKVLFLDFDGVLNSNAYLRREKPVGIGLDPARLQLLRQITDATQAKIVLSTSWRSHWDADVEKCDESGLEINAVFAQCGMAVYDKTPILSTGRASEIGAWLELHPETETFVVLDDAFLAADFLNGHFVKTSALRNGLDEENVQQAIEVLGSI